MKKYFSFLFKKSFTYGIGDITRFIITIIAVPIYTRVFTPEDYGVISYISNIGAILMIFLLLGTNNVFKYLFFETKNKRKKQLVISTGFYFIVLWALVIVGFSFIFIKYLNFLLFGNNTEYLLFIQISLVLTYQGALIYFMHEILRIDFKAFLYSFLNILDVIISFLIIVFLILHLRLGLLGIYIGSLITTSLQLIYLLFYAKKYLIFSFSFSVLKKLLKYGIPLVPAGMAVYIYTLADRFFIVKLNSLHDNGLYSIAVSFTQIFIFVIGAFSAVWNNMAYKVYCEDKNHPEFFARVLKYLMFVLVVLTIFISQYSWEILKILTTPAYMNAWLAVPILSLGMIAYGSTQVTTSGFGVKRKTYFVAYGAIFTAILNIILNILLIPKWSYLGASAATSLSYLALTLFYYFVSQKTYYLPHKVLDIFKLVVLGTLFTLSCYVFNNLSIPYLYIFFIKLLNILMFFIFLYVFKFFDKDEIIFIKDVLRKYKIIQK